MDFGLEVNLAFVGGSNCGVGNAGALELASGWADMVVGWRLGPNPERAA